MRNDIPNELEICFYVRGHDEAHSEFVIQFPQDYEPTQYAQIGCDDEGVYLATEGGDLTRIRGEEGVECWEHSQGMSSVHLIALDDTGEIHGEFEVVRVSREDVPVFGA
jgi:hypothetical protein